MRRLLLLFPAALLCAPAHAAGYYFSDVGVRSYSRAGAYVAGVSDLLALWYNPAALTRLPDGMATLDVAAVSQQVTFDRKDYPGEGKDGTDLVNEPIENGAPAYIIPHLAVSHSLGLPNTMFALGFYPPYAPDLSYPQDGPQRYTLTDTQVIQTFAGLSVAHEFANWVSVGGGLSWNYLYVEQELAISLWTQTETENPDYDVFFALDAQDKFAVGYNLGVLVEPPKGRWAVGASMVAPTQFHATGSMSADFSQNAYYDLGVIKSKTTNDDEVHLDVTMPLILKAGALVRPTDKLEVELAAVWEGWSVIDEIVVTDVNLHVDTALSDEGTNITDDVVLPAGYQDALSLRLGTEWDAHKRVTLRAGGMMEGSAIPAETMGVGLIDGKKWGYGLGGTFKAHKRIDVDLGWFQSFLPQQTIEGSEVKQIVVNPLTGEFVDGRVVGDGDLASHINILGGGINYYFGKDAKIKDR